MSNFRTFFHSDSHTPHSKTSTRPNRDTDFQTGTAVIKCNSSFSEQKFSGITKKDLSVVVS